MDGLMVQRSNPLVQIQDGGRFGTRHLGVTQGGAIDWISMYWANALLGNPFDSAVVEITFGGFSVQILRDGCLAIAGADLGATLNGTPIDPGCSFLVRQGQMLDFGLPIAGVRAYLAVPGGLDSQITLGSRSTVSRDCLGGIDGTGRELRRGDCLKWTAHSPSPKNIPRSLLTIPSKNIPLDVVIGSQISDFGGQSLFDFFNQEWTVDARVDRMGARLLGPQLDYQGKGLISEGVPLGAIQVPPDGQPIVLLNDRQTIGGYPRLGALTPRSLARMAQMRAGETLRFTPVLQEAAQSDYQRLLSQFDIFGS
ncbi:biotin-dependent carboxyltransferase family protein [Pseudomonas sp.]|uniref:5-oxoprolinase subunit C family protein n=1 Tax=Pseudomonas sp. TaxID=306 RepID=UPI002488EA1E|nr:biotin-dependent carboxyltransferase family protein [Pseudomonas sp.]MDI1332503.1 biotin-dependent carboxyltransferase family protein [Pseudomonas sp.]